MQNEGRMQLVSGTFDAKVSAKNKAVARRREANTWISLSLHPTDLFNDNQFLTTFDTVNYDHSETRSGPGHFEKVSLNEREGR